MSNIKIGINYYPIKSKDKTRKNVKFYHLPSFYVLLAANLITIMLAILEDWSFLTLLWIYWCQSIIIGVFAFYNIFTMRNFHTRNFLFNGKKVNPTKETAHKVALFFAVHYGLFHLVYALFIGASSKLGGLSISFAAILIGAATFFINHLFSYLSNREQDSKKQVSLGSAMFSPYKRIIPMHLILFIGGGAISFLFLKTIVDIFTHA